jgi:hypothetical protein
VTPYQRLKHRAFVIVAQGQRLRCVVPGCTARGLDLMHLDHINNDGCEHRKKTKKAGGVHIYRWTVNHPELARKQLQILCANHDRMKQKYGSVEAIVEQEQFWDSELGREVMSEEEWGHVDPATRRYLEPLWDEAEKREEPQEVILRKRFEKGA